MFASTNSTLAKATWCDVVQKLVSFNQIESLYWRGALFRPGYFSCQTHYGNFQNVLYQSFSSRITCLACSYLLTEMSFKLSYSAFNWMVKIHNYFLHKNLDKQIQEENTKSNGTMLCFVFLHQIEKYVLIYNIYWIVLQFAKENILI